MDGLFRNGALAAIALVMVVSFSRNDCAGQPAEQGRDGVLVLRDGGVLAGRIMRSGDRYIVARGGGEVQVAAGNVILVCASIEEAYQQRRQQMSRPTAEAHLALAEWCVRHNLLEQAKRELGDARALDSRHARLALLERRLALATERPRRRALESGRIGEGERGRQPEATSLPLPVSPSPTLPDLPSGAVERFTRKVQPVLVNNCTAAGCHQQGGAQQFQLDRALLHGLANRRSTMHNLAATLALVDRAQPERSPLLTVPREAHGGMESPVFGPRQAAAVQHVVEWVALVTQSTAQKEPPAADSILVSGEVERASKPPIYAEADTDAEWVDDAFFEPLSMPRPLKIGAQASNWTPRDPFDPEIFNRQHAARSASPHRLDQGVPGEGE